MTWVWIGKKLNRKVQRVLQPQTTGNPPTPSGKEKWQKLTRTKQTNKCTRSTLTSSLFPKRGAHNAQKNEETRGQRARGQTFKHKATAVKCNTHKPQPTPDTKWKRKMTKLTRRKQTNKCTRSTLTSSLFPKQDGHNAKKNEKTRGQRAREDLKHEAPAVKCHNYKPQPTPDTKWKRKMTKLTRTKQTNKCTRSTLTSSLFPKRGDHNAKKNEETRGQRAREDFKKWSARSKNHKATQNKNNTGTTALERSVA